MDAAATRGAYADARFVRSRSEQITTRNGEVDALHRDEAEGIGVRVRVGGAWGFAATHRSDRARALRADEYGMRRRRQRDGNRPRRGPDALVPGLASRQHAAEGL